MVLQLETSTSARPSPVYKILGLKFVNIGVLANLCFYLCQDTTGATSFQGDLNLVEKTSLQRYSNLSYLGQLVELKKWFLIVNGAGTKIILH